VAITRGFEQIMRLPPEPGLAASTIIDEDGVADAQVLLMFFTDVGFFTLKEGPKHFDLLVVEIIFQWFNIVEVALIVYQVLDCCDLVSD
jgi:hypothetical protein